MSSGELEPSNEQAKTEDLLYNVLRSLKDVPFTIDSLGEFTRQRDLNDEEMNIAREVFRRYDILEPRAVSFFYQAGSLNTSQLEVPGEPQDEVAAIAIERDVITVIYGFYKIDGQYSVDKEFQLTKTVQPYTEDETVFHRLVAQLPSQQEFLLQYLKTTANVDRVEPETQELAMLADLVNAING